MAPSRLGSHPLTAWHFAAAEVATRLGVDEGPLARLGLQVCIIGQVLLNFLSAGSEDKVKFTVILGGKTPASFHYQSPQNLQLSYVKEPETTPTPIPS